LGIKHATLETLKSWQGADAIRPSISDHSTADVMKTQPIQPQTNTTTNKGVIISIMVRAQHTNDAEDT
jgi:hypothetical protein